MEVGYHRLDIVTQLNTNLAATSRGAEHTLEVHICLLVTEAVREQGREEAIGELKQIGDMALSC